MSTKPQNVKGMRDLLPPAMMLRQHIIQTLRSVFERYGFEPLQTPALEYAETIEGKLGDEERLIYRFEDHGGRKLAMRYDQTVPLARVVAQYQSQLQLPWRRYAVGASYRGERTQRGRYREFYQADVDIVGSASPIADAEIIAVLTDALSALGFDNFVTLLSHRQILSGIARVSGLDESAAGGVYRAIDKLDKIGPDGVRTELANNGVAAEAIERILTLVSLTGDSISVLDTLAHELAGDERAQAAITNLRAIIAAPWACPATAIAWLPASPAACRTTPAWSVKPSSNPPRWGRCSVAGVMMILSGNLPIAHCPPWGLPLGSIACTT